MTYTEFKNKWIGKRVDADGVYQYQCVDLIRQYIGELYGLPTSGAWGNAIDYWTKTNNNVLTVFDRVAGTDARQGDIVIFNGTAGNVYGHIGIVDEQSADAIATLEQNGATGNGSGTGGDAIRLRWIPKSRVAGLLRPKGNNEDMITNTEEANLFYKAVLMRDGENQSVLQSNVGKPWHITLRNFLASPERKALEADIARLRTEYPKVVAQVTNLSEDVKKVQAQVTELTKVLAIKDGEISRLTKENESLRAQVGDTTKWETLKALVRELVGR